MGCRAKMASLNHSSFRLCGLLSLGAFAVLGFQSAKAANNPRTWDGGSDANWSQKNNWSNNTKPDADDTAIFAGTFTSGTTISLNGNQSANDLSITTGTNFSINNNILTLSTGKISRTATSGTTTINSGVAIGANATWTSAGTGVLDIVGNITGNFTIDKAGTGTAIIRGTNATTKAITISAGALRAANNTALGTTASGVSVTSGAALELDGTAGALVIGAEALTLNGTGVTAAPGGALRNIAGNNSYAGAITLNSASRINSDSGTLTLDVASGNSISGTQNLTIGGAGNVTVADPIATSTGTLTKDGAGTLALSGANTYTGLTTVSAGTLKYGASDVIKTGGVTVNGTGAVLDLATYTDSVGAFTLTSGTLKMAANQTGTAQLTSTGTAALGSGITLDLTGMSTSAGLYKLIAGTGANSRTGTFSTVIGLDSAYTLVYGSTNVDAQHKAAQAFSSPTATFDIITGGTHAVGATLTNSAPSGSAALVVSLANNSGTGGAVGSLSSSTGSTVVVGTPGTISGTFTAGASIGAGKTWSISNTDTSAVTSPVTTSGTVNVYDHASGSVGGTTLALGNVHVGYSSPVDSSSVSASNASGYRVNLTGSATAIGNLSLNSLTATAAGGSNNITATLATGQAAGAISQGFTYTFADSSALNGASSNVGTASLTVTGNVYTGTGVWNTNGSGNWGTLSTMTNWTTAGGAPGLDTNFAKDDTATFDNTALTAGNNATVTLNGANASLKGITFNTQAGSGYTLARNSTETLTLNNGTSDATVTVTSGTHTISAPVSLASNLAVSVTGGSDSLSVSGGISESGGSRALTKTGAGTLTLSGTNSYSGLTTIDAGTLAISSADNLSGTSGIRFEVGGSGTLYATSSLTLNKTIAQGDTSPGAGKYLVDSGTTLTLSGVISGAGQFQKEGDGAIILNNANNYSGRTVVNAGILQLGTSGSIINDNMDIVGGTYDMNGHNQYLANTLTLGASNGSTAGTILSSSGTSTLTVDSSIAVRNGKISANLAGTAGLTKATAATVTLSGTNTYGGATAVNGGKLTIDATGTINSTTAVTIGAGEFNYNSTAAALSKGVSFTSTGGTLSGSGTITTPSGVVDVTSGNTHTAGGVGTVGQQTFTNGIKYESGSVFEWDLTTASNTYDKVLGALTVVDGAQFKVVSNTAFDDTFWNTNHTWSDIFESSVAGFNVSNFLYSAAGNPVAEPAGEGYFTTNTGALVWTAVPEPSSALAGLLLAAGLLRRRR